MASIINATTTAGVSVQGDNSGSLQLATNNGTTALTIDTSQNVTASTSITTPTATINNAGASTVLTVGGDAASTVPEIRFKMNSATRYNFQIGIGTQVNDAFTVTPSTAIGGTTFTTPAMVVNSSGNVGIGTSSPKAPLSFSNSASSAASINKISLYDDATNPIYGFGISANQLDYVSAASHVWYSGASERMRIASNGIITMSAYGAGAATFSAAGVISSVSDETWKIKDGVPTNPDAMLQKLEAGYWFYNEEKAPIFGKERQLGFYAQNVHEAIGEEAAPTPEEGKPWGYYDRSVLAVTVMSLKNALSTIEELKERIATLENK